MNDTVRGVPVVHRMQQARLAQAPHDATQRQGLADRPQHLETCLRKRSLRDMSAILSRDLSVVVSRVQKNSFSYSEKYTFAESDPENLKLNMSTEVAKKSSQDVASQPSQAAMTREEKEHSAKAQASVS